MPTKIIVQAAAAQLADQVGLLLEPFRYEVHRATDVDRTVRLARRHGPVDLVLCLDAEERDLPTRLAAVSPTTRTLHLPVADQSGGLITTPGVLLDATELMHLLERAVGSRRRSPELSVDALKRSLMESILVHGELLAQAGLTDAGDLRAIQEHAVAIAHELGLSPTHTDEVALAALLQDVGLAALRIDDPEGQTGRVRAHPIESVTLIEKMHLPWDTAHIVRAHHERYDGLGYPNGLRGEEIPLGARILAAVNAYFSMIRGRSGRSALTEREALQHLRSEAGRQFDPEIIEVLLASLRPGVPEASAAHHIGIVTGDLSFGTVTRSKFEDLGHRTEVHRRASDALVALRERPPDAIILDAGLADTNGFQLLHWIKQEEELAAVPILVVSDRDDEAAPSFLAHDMGASDFLCKPVRPSRLVRRINALVRRRARMQRATLSQIHDGEGLRGRLDDLGTPEIVRMLLDGSKTASVTLIGDDTGGTLSFDGGRLVHARTSGAVGEAAFEELYGLSSGQFIIEHGAATAERSIARRTDELLVEMESIRGAVSDASISTPSVELRAAVPEPVAAAVTELTVEPDEPVTPTELDPSADAPIITPAWPALSALLRPDRGDGDDTVELEPPELEPEPQPEPQPEPEPGAD